MISNHPSGSQTPVPGARYRSGPASELLAASAPSVVPGDMLFRGVLEVLPAGAYICDADGLITYFNRHAVEIWGREPQLNEPVDRY